MKNTALLLSLLAAAASVSAQPTGVVPHRPLVAASPAPAACPALLQQRFKRLQDEAPQDLCQYAGKVVLVVNTASYCGYTKQYEGLEKLYAKYSPRGLVVLGFPSNDFKQEAASTKEIADLCYNTYGVKFPMFAPTVVSGANANPLHAALAQQTGKQPKWNFTKYLIGRDGNVIAHFPSKVTPDDPDLLKQIEGAL
jgi:glutathione peroxidase